MPEQPNDFFYGVRSWQKAKNIVRHPRFFEGFTEAMAGAPYDYRKADGLKVLDQHRYENGREIAVECRCAGLCFHWRDRDRIPAELKSLVVARVEGRRDWLRRSDPHRLKRLPERARPIAGVGG